MNIVYPFVLLKMYASGGYNHITKAAHDKVGKCKLLRSAQKVHSPLTKKRPSQRGTVVALRGRERKNRRKGEIKDMEEKGKKANILI